MDAYTWILVIDIWANRHESSRTRGLTEAACLTLVQEVRSPTTTAYCYRDGGPDPGWRRPRVKERPQCDECRPPKGLGWG
jgi:hypothetical protein